MSIELNSRLLFILCRIEHHLILHTLNAAFDSFAYQSLACVFFRRMPRMPQSQLRPAGAHVPVAEISNIADPLDFLAKFCIIQY